MLTAVRADAWLHARGDLASPQGRDLKVKMRDAFYGDADDWKGMVAGQSLLATRQAIKGLAARASPLPSLPSRGGSTSAMKPSPGGAPTRSVR